MPQVRKTERNKKIVKLREDNKLSFPQIGKLVGLKHHSQVMKIYKRDLDLYKGDR
jgi:chromosomal replication initiation ATPase DnaA